MSLYKKIFIAAILLGITLLHYITPTQMHPLHELYKVLYFIPIILGAFLFGLRGGIFTAMAATALYLPHVMFQWGGSFVENISRFLMILLYIILGSLTGYLWEQERKQRRHYQEASEQLAESLRRLEKTTDELQLIEGQLRSAERLSTLGELTASLAHEVRNPLASIRGVAEILRDESVDNKHHEFITILLKEVQWLDNVVASYLNLARQKSADKAPVNLRAVLDSTRTLLGPEIRKKSLAVTVQVDDGMLLNCREDHLRQALLNVLLNAIQANPQGGKLDLTAVRENGTVRISIADSGSGLSKEAKEKLFDPFFSERDEGTGLGLAITKRIVESHGGKVFAVNNTPTGAVITMEFPE